MNVYVLIIEGKNFDPTPSVHRTPQEAEEALENWVLSQWKEEMGSKHCPTNRPQMVAAYFDQMFGDESYAIHTCSLEEKS